MFGELSKFPEHNTPSVFSRVLPRSEYKCDFNRDNGWTRLGELGFEPVRQVAIDDDWSALRFRRVGFIKTMTRSFAMTEEGKARIKKISNND